MSKFAVILPAAGKSARFGDRHKKKVYCNLGSKPMWMVAAEAFVSRKDVAQTILVISSDDRDYFNEKFAGNAAMLGLQVVLGGTERADSVKSGLEAVGDEVDFVAVHDAARPCVAAEWIDAVFAAARRSDAAILATPCHATVKRVDPRRQIQETVPRDGLWLAQTPQAFRKSVLVKAYSQRGAQAATDEASLVEQTGHPVEVVEGSPLNVKVTTKSDLRFAELALKALPKANPFPF